MFKYLLSYLFPPKHKTIDYVPADLDNILFLFGSRRWNVHTPSSDVDLGIRSKDLPYLKVYLESHSIPFKAVRTGYHSVLTSYRFRLNNLSYEVSIMNDATYDRYVEITKILDIYTIEEPKFRNKDFRVSVFRDLSYYLQFNEPLPTPLAQFLSAYFPELVI